MQAALLAEYLCNLQPLYIRNRLLHDQTFGARFSLGSRMVIGIGGDMHVDQQKLFAAARQALRDQQAASLTDVYGHEMSIKADQGRVVLESPSQGGKAQLDEFMIFSPNQEERTRALRHWIDRLGPTTPDFSVLLTKAAERELNDEEIGELFAERASGMAAFQSRAAAAFNMNQVTLEKRWSRRSSPVLTALIPMSYYHFGQSLCSTISTVLKVGHYACHVGNACVPGCRLGSSRV